MGITKTKVISGPFTVIGYDSKETEEFKYEGLKNDALLINTEDETNELEDYTSELVGRRLNVEITISELDESDLDSIEAAASVEIEFSNKGKILKISPDEIRPKVDNGKTKIIIRKFIAGDNWPFTLEDIPEESE